MATTSNAVDLAAGRDAAFGQLYAEYGTMVQQLCLGYAGGRAALAEDLCQEVFLNAWRGLDGFRGGASAKTWLYRITVNTCLEEVRRRERRHETELPDALSGEAGAAETDDDVTHARLYAAIGQLPKLDRLLLMLQLDGQTNAQIATVTGLTANHIRVRTHRSRARLREIIL